MDKDKLAAFCDEALAAHNRYREYHSADPLQISTALNKSAQEWAKNMAGQKTLTNSPAAVKAKLGESITSRTGGSKPDVSGEEITKAWYADKEHYDFKTHTGPAGNFTQMIWRSCTHVGFGVAHKNGRTVVVAQYEPPGNIRGQFPNNVFPSLESFLPRASVSSSDQPAIEKTIGRPTTTKVVKETITEPSGERYTINKEITEYTDEQGNITQRVKEVRLDNVFDMFSASESSSDSDGEETKRKSLSKPKKIDKELKDYQKIILKVHNVHRKSHGVSPLKINKDLNHQSQKWAEYLCRQTRLSNSANIYKGNRLGENIASRWSAGNCEFPAQEVVDHWYSEEKKYNYSEEPTSVKGIGNFTQVIWRNCRELGVGRAVHVSSTGGTKVVIVCQYFPPGNVITCFTHNVPPPLSTASTSNFSARLSMGKF